MESEIIGKMKINKDQNEQWSETGPVEINREKERERLR